MNDEKLEEKVINLSTETKISATLLLFEYISYIEAGLKPKVAYQYMEFKYTNEIKPKKHNKGANYERKHT